jgi:hypothetical protein
VAWILALIFVPVLATLIYVLAHGRGMAERQRTAAERSRAEADAYIRQTAGMSPTDQIARAKQLLDAHAISPTEFEILKGKALA